MKSTISRRSFFKSVGAAAAAGGFSLSGLPNLIGSGQLSRRAAADLPRLVYIFPGAPQPDVKKVQDALSAYIADRIGATIELRAIDWGAFDKQISLINASAEKYDLAFTAPWVNNYYTNISQEYLAPIGDRLTSLAPKYFGSLTPAMWAAATVGGKIFGGINQQIFVKPFGPYIRTDVLEAIGLKDDFNKLTTYETLEPIMAAVKKYIATGKDKTLTHVTYNLSPIMTQENWGYDPQDFMLVVKSTDTAAQVKIWSQTDEYRKAAELVRRWYQAGYAPTDVKLWSEQDNAWKAGQYAIRVSDIVKPGGNVEILARWGQAVTSKAIAEPLLTTGGVTATLTGVSAVSANTDLAVKYLELVNTDPVFYNMLCKGIEGVHWDWADKAKGVIKPGSGKTNFGDTGYNPNTDWMYGNVFNSYYADASQVGAWAETAKLNKDARPSPVLGFTFDRKSVETEIASISAAQKEFADPLGTGIVDVTDGLAKLNKALKAAGIEKIRDEMQKQIDVWKAKKA